MEFHLKSADHVSIVEIIGEMNENNARELQQHLLPQIEAASKILLDMSKVDYMLSAGLRILLLLYRQVKKNNGAIVLVGLPDEIRDIMSVTGFLRHFVICSTIEEGLQTLQESACN